MSSLLCRASTAAAMTLCLSGTAAGAVTLLGRCDLDPPALERPQAACLQGYAGTSWEEGRGQTQPDPTDGSLSYADLSLGLFATPTIALQSRGWVAHYADHQSVHRTRHDLKHLYLHVGSPIQGPGAIQLFAGILPLPFGIEHNPLPLQHQLTRDRAFWSSHNRTLRLSYLAHSLVGIDLGVAQDTPAPKAPVRWPAALRLFADIPAAHVTRVTISTLYETATERRLSLGLINQSRRNDRLTVEWYLRQRPTYRQGLSVGFEGTRRGRTRWIALYEQESWVHRTGTVGLDLGPFLSDHLLIRTAIRYAKTDSPRWTYLVGVEAHL